MPMSCALELISFEIECRINAAYFLDVNFMEQARRACNQTFSRSTRNLKISHLLYFLSKFTYIFIVLFEIFYLFYWINLNLDWISPLTLYNKQDLFCCCSCCLITLDDKSQKSLTNPQNLWQICWQPVTSQNFRSFYQLKIIWSTCSMTTSWHELHMNH